MRLIKVIGIICLIGLFVYLRFNNISNSFFFWNDMGRDMTVLQTWRDTSKPPLLGPQTSALPFNQSAVYFYLLYPGFLISHGNPASSLYTLAFFYVLTFVTSIYFFKNHLKIFSLIFFLLSINPQYIIQGRFVWNPSFVSPLILISIFSFHQLLKKFSYKLLIGFSLDIALAVSLSYSVAPLLIAFVIYWLIFYRQHFIKFFISIIASFFIFNLPTLFFELRHHFLLTNSLLTKNSPIQEGLGFIERLNRFSQYIFSTGSQSLNIILFLLFIILATYFVIAKFKTPHKLSFLASFLFLVLVVLGFTVPISIQAHYVFAFLCLIFIIIATLPIRIKAVFLILFSFIYLNPGRLKSYFKPAPRTYSQMQQCFTQYCTNFKQPTYVSVQSSYHPFHNGPEHRFMLRQAGCSVLDIETQNGQSKYMSVVVDMGSFSDQTKYYELDLFGKFKTISTLSCLPNFQVLTLEKI